MKRKPLLLLTCFCCSLMHASAQTRVIHGRVVNRFSHESVALASVVWKNAKNGVATDSAGYFSIHADHGTDTLLVSHVGFTSVAVPKGPEDILTIELVPLQTEAVTVRSKYTKGFYWWKKVVQHKTSNNPDRFNTWSCQRYKKLELDLNHVTREGIENNRLLKPFGFIADDIDSTSGEGSFLPVFMTESVSQYYSGAHPHRQREEVKARQTNGMKNGAILHFIDGIGQNLNVYDNYITLFGKTFISPLSNAGDSWYNYRGADTLTIAGQHYLHLFFTPKHPGENTFSGECWIHRTTWAVSNIRMDISSTANINFVHRLTIRQAFARQADSSWIFAKDECIADVSPLGRDKLSMIARQTNLYRDVRVDQPDISSALQMNTEPSQVIEAPDAGSQTASAWEQLRPEPLSGREQRLYKMIDTLKSIPLFQEYTRAVKFVVDGRIQLGKFAIGPWYKWISGNEREKVRLRFDLATTEEFSKLLYWHGYIAYGMGDGEFKGRLDMRYVFPDNSGFFIKASWLRDLDNGRARIDDEGVTTDNLFSNLIRRPGIRQKFIMVEESNACIGKAWPNKFTTEIGLKHTSYKTFNPLPPVKWIAPNERNIVNTEGYVRLKYAPDNHPAYEIGYAAGTMHYQKLQARISQNVNLRSWGKLDYQVYGGMIWGGPLPFMMLEIHPGNETYYYSKQAFNLMSRYEYASDRYAGFSAEQNFDKKLLNLLPFMRRGLCHVNIRQFWNIKAVWGDMSEADKKLNCKQYGTYRLKSLTGKPYVELGTGLDNIFTYFRLDFVWRFAPTQPASTGIQLPVHPRPAANFGIFGSFHLQF